MCGIVGYVGTANPVNVLLDGLKRLEYRGYDSSGIALLCTEPHPAILRHRAAGKIADMENTIPASFAYTGGGRTAGIAHTRWATHGKPSEENAHPHTDCAQRFVLVHNGIIENHAELRAALPGHTFRSDTDTEVIVHLLEHHYHGDVTAAMEKTMAMLEGSYAFALLSVHAPGTVFFARKDSPLVLGIGDGELFIASDVTAMLAHTSRFIFLENGDYGAMSDRGVEIRSLATRSSVQRPEQRISWDPIMVEKGGYRHFMLKEIHEQPQVIRENIINRVFDNTVTFAGELSIADDILRRIRGLTMVACGTSYHAALIGKYFIEKLVGIPVEVDIASEYRYRDPIIQPDTLAVFISQSGETADTLACLQLVRERGLATLGICNVTGSSLTRATDATIYTRCGPEIGVASTKAFTGQLVCLYLFGLYLARLRNSIPRERHDELLAQLYKVPTLLEHLLADTRAIDELAHTCHRTRDFLYLGRGINYPVALEGALKLKEISYIHAEGYPAGEMKHGPIALIDEDMPVVVIATKGLLMQKIFSNLEEAKSRDARIIALINEGTTADRVDHALLLPEIDELLSPILNVVPLQLLAYRIAVILGRDVDQPRNLAKSVTVE